jgi:hypothetical protein
MLGPMTIERDPRSERTRIVQDCLKRRFLGCRGNHCHCCASCIPVSSAGAKGLLRHRRTTTCAAFSAQPLSKNGASGRMCEAQLRGEKSIDLRGVMNVEVEPPVNVACDV